MVPYDSTSRRATSAPIGPPAVQPRTNASEVVVGKVRHEVECGGIDDRRAEAEGNALFLNCFQKFDGMVLAQQHDGSAHVERGHEPVVERGGSVPDRDGHEQSLVPSRRHGEGRGDGNTDDVAVAVDAALGRAGSPRGVEDFGRIVLVDVDTVNAVLAGDGVVEEVETVCDRVRADQLGRCLQSTDNRRQLTVEDAHRHLRVSQHVGNFRSLHLVVDGGPRRAQAPGTEHRVHESRSVVTHQRDAVARLHAQRLQIACGASTSVLNLGVRVIVTVEYQEGFVRGVLVTLLSNTRTIFIEVLVGESRSKRVHSIELLSTASGIWRVAKMTATASSRE